MFLRIWRKVSKKNPFFHKAIQTYQKYYTRKSELKIIKTRDFFVIFDSIHFFDEPKKGFEKD